MPAAEVRGRLAVRVRDDDDVPDHAGRHPHEDRLGRHDAYRAGACDVESDAGPGLEAAPVHEAQLRTRGQARGPGDGGDLGRRGGRILRHRAGGGDGGALPRGGSDDDPVEAAAGAGGAWPTEAAAREAGRR